MITKTDANTIVVTEADITAIGSALVGFATAIESGEIVVPGFAKGFFNEIVERSNVFVELAKAPLNT